MVEAFLDFLFPSKIYCISCGSIIDKTRSFSICDNCIEKFQWISKDTCIKCGKALIRTDKNKTCRDCRNTTHYFDKGYTCCKYGLYERNLLMECKYGNKGYLAKKIGDIMAFRIGVEDLDVDFVIPVPLHKKRERKRGYNQAEIMACQISKKLGIDIKKNALYRKRETLPMKGLGIQERKENIKDCFSVFSAQKGSLENKKILLIDDIYTTGATCDSCSKVLKENGVAKIYILTFAAGISSDIM